VEEEQLDHQILMEITAILEFKVLVVVEVVRLGQDRPRLPIKYPAATVVPVSSSSLTHPKTPLLVV
jgi:hypothetical protein